MKHPRFVAVGDVMVDISVRGGPGHEADVSLRAGGTAANTAVWAASIGAESTVIGRIGDDLAGGLLRDALVERGVTVELALDRDLPTGTFVLLGEKAFVERGANAAFGPEHLPDSIEGDIVAVSPYLEQATAEAAVQRARAPWLAALGKPLRGANAVVLSELETDEGVHVLGERFRLACVTLGGLGALALLDGEETSASTPSVQTGDATGAGDAFAAGLLVSVAQGATLADALAVACRLGAESAASPTGWPVVK